MATKIQVVFYSMYGHIYRMAEAVVAALANYVTGRFGARAATITPDQVAGRREKE